MEPDDRREETIPTRPVVFAGVGPCAIGTLAQLLQAAQDLRIRVAGPFGLVVATHPDSGITVSDYQWLSDIKLSGPELEDGRGSQLTGDDDALVSSFTSLIRRLRVDCPNIIPDSSPRVRVCAYSLIDLSDPRVVPASLRLARLLRIADPSLSITGLALTGRTAQSQADIKEPWFDAFRLLLERLQQESPLQRLYVLDGRDTNNTWLQTIEQMQRLGAEFLLHHGLSPYRSHLRRNEKGRVTPEQDFLQVCGSFSCRTLRGDRAAVAQGVAARLAREDLADLDQGALSEDRADKMDEEARKLADRIAQIFHGNGQTGPDGVDQPPGNRDDRADRNRRLRDAIESALTSVCAEQPVFSLRWFLKSFDALLEQLSMSSALTERVATRFRTFKVLTKQVLETYKPIRQWLAEPGTVWDGRYAPRLNRVPLARVSRPASAWAYGLGLVVSAIGLGGVAVAAMGQGAIFALVGGVLAIGASAIMALPSGWVDQRRTVVGEDEKATDLKWHAYRREAPAWSYWLTGVLLGSGLISVGWSLLWPAWLGVESAESKLLAVLSLLLLVLGLGLRAWPHEARRPADAAGRGEMPDLAGSPRWAWRAAALTCLAVAWIGLCWAGPDPMRVVGVWPWVGLGGGLLMILGGLGVGCWPWMGQGPLIHRTPRMPVPLPTALAQPAHPSEMIEHVKRIESWRETLLAEPRRRTTDGHPWPRPQPVGTVLDALVKGWDERLAALFRRHLQARPELSLADLARSPEYWAKCLTAELASPTVGLADPAYLLAINAVNRWMEDRPLDRLIAELGPDPHWFDQFMTRSLAPRWPPTRTEPHVDTGVLAVGEDLWDIVAPLAQAGGAHRLLRVRWQHPYTLVVIRTAGATSIPYRASWWHSTCV